MKIGQMDVKKQSWKSFRLSIAAAAAVFASPVEAGQIRSEQELQQLREKISSLKSQFENNRSRELEILSELKEFEQEYADLAARKRGHVKKLESLQSAQEKTKEKLQRLHEADLAATETLEKLALSGYLFSRQDSIRILLNDRDPAEISRGLTMYRYIVESRYAQIEAIRKLRKRVARTAEEIQSQQREMEGVLDNLAESQTALTASEKKRQRQLAAVREKLSDGQSKLKLYRQRESELRALLASLQRSDAAEDAADGPPDSNQSAKKAAVAGAIKPGGFRNNKGNLPMPAQAAVNNRFGQIRPESGLVWEGLMLDVEEGQEVSAIYPGQVVFSDWFRGYGQLLVIDHGDGYMSLYGHNQNLQVQLGSLVDTGDLIALAGSSGGLSRPGLYFEIRSNGVPDDPLVWCRR